MTAPSIKEALELAIKFIESHMHYSQPGPDAGEEPSDMLTHEALPVVVGIRAALATLQPDGERREAIAFKIYSHSNNPKLWDRPNSVLARDNAYSIADLLLASGLVQDEAAIRRDEREKCAEIAETYRRKVVGRDMKEATFDPAGRWEGGAVYDAPTIQSGIASAIRSARDGGAES